MPIDLMVIDFSATLAETLMSDTMSYIDNYCVILAGGVGSRFWPYSRKKYPKQFIDFFGTGYTLLQHTYQRFKKIVPEQNIIVVTNAAYGAIVKEQLPQLPEGNLLLEPLSRNTAPSVAWAAYHIFLSNPNANMVVAPADQFIMKEDEFREAIQHGLDFVSRTDKLLTVGMVANRPETAYGYIQIDEEHEDDIYKVKSFTEKPELNFAKFFVESGEFYWNSGLFLWNVNAILHAMYTFLPEIGSLLDKVRKDHFNRENEQKFVEAYFPACPNISIDYGVLEKSDNVYVLTGDFGWSDLGNWNTFYEMSPKDKNGNVTIGSKTLLYDCHNNVITTPPDRLVVLKNLDGYVVVEKDNVLVVCKKDDTEAIRQFVNDVQVRFGDD